MPLPVNLSVVTVTGRYVRADGTAAAGRVSFTLASLLTDAAAPAFVLRSPAVATLDYLGGFTVTLVASDDPDAAPSGVTYQVDEAVDGGSRSYSVLLPLATPTVDLATLAPVTTSTGNAPGPVTTVAGRTGAVVLAAADVAGVETPAGATAKVAAQAVVDAGLYAPVSALAPSLMLKRPVYTLIETFQAGHVWTATGTTGWSANLNDTSSYLIGSQSVKMTTGGGANFTNIRRTGMTNLDAANKSFAVLVKVDDVTNLEQIYAFAGNGGLTQYYSLKIAAGGTVGNASLRSGEWTWLHVNWAAVTSTNGAPSKATITDFYLAIQDKGAPLNVQVGAVAHFPANTAFPSGVVTFSFDDSYLSPYTNARRLDLYGHGANAFVIADQVGQPGLISMAQLTELERKKGWEVCGHAFTVAAHNAGMPTLSAPALAVELRSMKDWLRSNGFRGADLFSYPLGSDVPSIETTLSQYFSTARHTVNTPRQVLPIDTPYHVRALTVTNVTAVATVTAEIDLAFTNGTMLNLIFHNIVTTAVGSTDYSIADFNTIVDYCNTKGIPVRTMGDVLRAVA